MSWVLTLAMVCLAVLVGAATPAAAAPACSAVEVAPGAWLGGAGVTVHSNGANQGSGSSCAGLSTSNPGVQDGYGWQCVELAARLYAVKGWGRVYADGGAAAGIYRYGAQYIPEGSPALAFHPNGSGYLPVPGDLIIESYPSGWGHVSVVDQSVGSSVYAVEHNASPIGRPTYPLTGSTLSGQYGGGVRGVMHAPANTATHGGGASPVTNGSFIQIAGHPEVYRIAGGAPTYVSTWAAFGGTKAVTILSQASFDALRPVPADGTFVAGAQRGEVYRIAGGAPTYVSTWAGFGGAQPTMTIDQVAIDNAGAGGVWNHLSYRPADGTFVAGGQRGEVYRMVGGAPLYVSTWGAYGGAKPFTTIDQVAIDKAGAGGVWNHLSYRPADGTFVAGAQRGEVYRMVGGAPLYVSTWGAFGGAQPTVTLDQVAIDNAGAGGVWNHLSYRPADGTFVTGAQRGEVYRFTGGAPLYVSTWAPFGGPQTAVVVDQGALDSAAGRSGAFSHALLAPADGTFVTGVPSGRVFQVSSGVATWVSNWTPYGGPKPTVAVNDAALDHAGAATPWQHLVSAAAISTLSAPSLSALSTTTTAAQVSVSWTRPIIASALSSFDVRWASATPTTALSPWQYPAGWSALSGTSVTSQALAVGATYCYSVRAHNLAGQTGQWSPAACLTRPVDDRSASASSGWTRPGADSRFYASTYSNSTRAGATLTLAGVHLSRVTLLATRCAVCGTVGVYVGTALVGTINLAAPATRWQSLVTMAPFSYRTGTVTVRVLSNGRLVQIDGIAISPV